MIVGCCTRHSPFSSLVSNIGHQCRWRRTYIVQKFNSKLESNISRNACQWRDEFQWWSTIISYQRSVSHTTWYKSFVFLILIEYFSCADTFRWADIIPIWPKSTSDNEPPVDRWLFFLLHTISDTCKRICWDSSRESTRIEKQEECFRFLFDMFKRYYLPTLFSSFQEQNIYDLSQSSKIEFCSWEIYWMNEF